MRLKKYSILKKVEPKTPLFLCPCLPFFLADMRLFGLSIELITESAKCASIVVI